MFANEALFDLVLKGGLYIIMLQFLNLLNECCKYNQTKLSFTLWTIVDIIGDIVKFKF